MKIRTLCIPIAVLFLMAAIHAQNKNPALTFRNLSSSKIASLAGGEIVFRQAENWKDLSIPVASPFYKEIVETLHKGNHNYIGEVLVVMTRTQAMETLPVLTARLLDFESYAGVPYWSERNERQYDLFDWIKVTDGNRSPLKGWVNTTQFMLPFGEYSSTYEWTFTPEKLSYTGINTSPLSYKGVRAVTSGNMIWRFRAYFVDDYCVFYGLGAVKAFDLFGTLRERLSTSFMGRIEAFFRYVYGEKETL